MIMHMMQSHLLPSQPPYQIICAGGEVGIQVATLVVVENKTDADGNYAIETHSHPVVNYGMKDNVAELYKKDKDKAEFLMMWQLLPEGAVWDKVEISDVKVLGLAGITEDISLEGYLDLIPSVRSEVVQRLWNHESIESMHFVPQKLKCVGIEIRCTQEIENDEINIIVYPTYNEDGTPLVSLSLYEMDLFSYPLYDDEKMSSVMNCASALASALSVLNLYFVPQMTSIKLKTEMYEMGKVDDSTSKDITMMVEMVNDQITYKP